MKYWRQFMKFGDIKKPHDILSHLMDVYCIYIFHYMAGFTIRIFPFPIFRKKKGSAIYKYYMSF